jgi:maleylacetate reductase
VQDGFLYDALPGRVVFGPGVARQRLAAELDGLGAERVLLVAADPELPLARELTGPLGDRVVAEFSGVRPHVPVGVAQAAREEAARSRADLVLSIGGGSTTGTAKAVALTTGLPVVAVPTTYAGSEVTPVWGLTEAARKTTGRDARVLPRVVLYDPELTLTLPADLSAASGLNALAHCVEALWAPGANPVTSLVALEGVRALAAGLPAVVADPSGLAGRTDALYGAYLAGAAFAVAGSGLHHTVCHVLGGAYDLPHAPTHAVVLPHVLALYAPRLPEVERSVAAALGVPAAVKGLVDLAARTGAPSSLADAGLTAAQLPEAGRLVSAAVATKVPPGPLSVTADEVHALLRAALDGPPHETHGGSS